MHHIIDSTIPTRTCLGLATSSVAAPTDSKTQSHAATRRKEQCYFFALAGLTLLGIVGHWFLPLTPDRIVVLMASLNLPAKLGGHHFADTQSWFGIVNAVNVLSNLPFAAMGVWGLWLVHQLSRIDKSFNTQAQSFLGFFAGLLLTTVCSSLYHLAPSDSTLLWDRVGMAVAFAGVIGVATNDRVSPLSAVFALRLTLLAAALSLWVWSLTTDVLPWVIVQFGGMGIIVCLSFMKSINPKRKISLWVIVGFYTLAKVFESLDHTVFEATSHWLSGHSLKHFVASLAALPVIVMLKRSVQKCRDQNDS